jgi:flagellar biosynthetic protein FlhB
LADNRTEKATPRRRQQARDKGQVLRNRDLVSALSLFAVILFLAWRPQAWIGRWQNYFAHSLDASLHTDWAGTPPVLSTTLLTVAQWVAPIFGLALAISVVATLSQGGLTIATEALSPDISRLSPVNNLRQLFSFSGLSRILKSLVPTVIILYLALRLLASRVPEVLHASRLPAHASLSLLGSLWFGIAWQSAFVLLLWSGVDFLLQWQTFEHGLRMTKQEVRQENKDNEGSPQIKGRIRRLRRELLRKSLHKDVQRATAVITNPTHYAVALEYRPSSMPAPVVVAKGRNLIAQKIRELARWHEIPLIENPPLAQALYKGAEVGQMIPPKLYAAVAEILAFLYRAQMRMQGNLNSQKAGG